MAKLEGIMIWVADVEATARFYQEAFDLTPSQLDTENGFALIDAGGVDLQFADERAAARTGVDVGLNRSEGQAPGAQLALVDDDVEAAFDRAVAAGAQAVAPVTTKPWGQRVGYVRDLNGFLVELASPSSW